jgi:hypothetical protein
MNTNLMSNVKNRTGRVHAAKLSRHLLWLALLIAATLLSTQVSVIFVPTQVPPNVNQIIVAQSESLCANTTITSNTNHSIENVTTKVRRQAWSPGNFTHPKLLERIELTPECASPNWTTLSNELNSWVWADMDWPAAKCGTLKCFYPSLTDDTTGYLVGREKLEKQMLDATRITLGSKSLNIPGEVPHLVPVSMDMRCFLKNTSYQPHYPEDQQVIVHKTSEEYVVVYRMRRAPDPSILIYNTQRGLKSFVEQWPAFAQQTGLDDGDYCKKFQRELKWVKEDCMAYQGLGYDFQVLLGTDGKLMHMDVDRIFEYPVTEERSAVWLKTLDKIFELLLATVCKDANLPDAQELLANFTRDY